MSISSVRLANVHLASFHTHHTSLASVASRVAVIGRPRDIVEAKFELVARAPMGPSRDRTRGSYCPDGGSIGHQGRSVAATTECDFLRSFVSPSTVDFGLVEIIDEQLSRFNAADAANAAKLHLGFVAIVRQTDCDSGPMLRRLSIKID